MRPQTNKGTCNILVIEDDYIVALDLCTQVESLGITVIGPAGKLDEGLDLARTVEPLHGAILDVNISNETVFPIADELIERNVPIVFATAYDMTMLPARFRHFPRVDKPMDPGQILRAVRQMCESRSAHPGAQSKDRPAGRDAS